MPSLVHEALVDLFRARPHLAAELLAAVAAISPDIEVQGALLDADLSQVAPTEYHADAVVRLSGPGLDLLVIIEIQLRLDANKAYVWPGYAGVACTRHRCPVAILVITLDAATARWAAQPIHFGPGSVLTPIVVGPRQMPVVVDPEIARQNPEIAVLSAMAHGHGPDAARVGVAAAEAARDLDEARARLYLDLVLSSLNPAARTLLEGLMIENWQPQSDFFKRLDAAARAAGIAAREAGMAEGLEQGLEQGLERGTLRGQRALLSRQLQRRFGPLPARILAAMEQADAEALGQWAEDLLFADSLDALFGAEPAASP